MPTRHGFIRPTANGHAFEYADGTPFLLLGDTWYAAATFRFPWNEGDKERPIGPEAGFKDYLRLRQSQGFNSVLIIAAFPNWANDSRRGMSGSGRPATLPTPRASRAPSVLAADRRGRVWRGRAQRVGWVWAWGAEGRSEPSQGSHQDVRKFRDRGVGAKIALSHALATDQPSRRAA